MKRIFAALLVVLALCGVLAMPVCASEADRLATEWRVYAYLTQDLNLNTAAACGILANIETESNFRLTALGDSGTSYGLCQWHAGRFTALKNYCATQNLDYSSVLGQLSYLGFELRTSYSGLLSQLRQVENTDMGAYTAGYLWCTRFERPADPEAKGVIRGTNAQTKYWNRYRNMTLIREEQTTVGFALGLIDSAKPSSDSMLLVSSSNLTSEKPAPSASPALPTVAPEDSAQAQPEAPVEASQAPSEASVHTHHRARFRAYTPRHTPTVEPPVNWETGILAGLPFQIMGDGTKRRVLLPVPEEAPEPEPV